MSGYDCYCELEGDEGEPPEFWSESRPVARKEHTCLECGGSIHPGERYWRVSGKWEGGLDTFCTCAPCEDGPFAFVRRNCPCWTHGDLFRHLREDVLGEYDSDIGLAPDVRERIERWLVEADERRAAVGVAA